MLLLQQASGGDRLGFASVVEGDVPVALQAALRIPRGFPVAHDGYSRLTPNARHQRTVRLFRGSGRLVIA